MSTTRLIIDLIAFALIGAFLLFFVPLVLNTANTFTNVLGVAAVVGLVIGIVGAVHKKFTSNKEQ